MNESQQSNSKIQLNSYKSIQNSLKQNIPNGT